MGQNASPDGHVGGGPALKQLTRYTDYSLRALIYWLAVHQEELATIEEIAKGCGISKAHLMKIVYQLGLAGYVETETVRGRGGGLRLAQPPRISALVRWFGHTETMPLVDASIRRRAIAGPSLCATYAPQ